MQLQGLLFVLLMLVITPLLVVSSDHNVFFSVFALVMLIVSFRNIHIVMFSHEESKNEDENAELDDMESMLNLDVKLFGVGTRVARNLIVLLFLFYCSFFTGSVYLKLLICATAAYRVYDMLANLKGEKEEPGENVEKNGFLDRAAQLPGLFANVSMVLIIVLVVYNKYINFMF